LRQGLKNLSFVFEKIRGMKCFSKIKRKWQYGSLIQSPPANFRLIPESFCLIAEGFSLIAEGFRLIAEGFCLIAEGFRLIAEGFRLIAEGFRLIAEDRQWSILSQKRGF
jgi:hypothetical protein